jgi:dephospho-CoA kinase
MYVKRIFILNGSGGVGKDTFVDLVSHYIPTIHFSSVTKVKEIAKAIGWDGGKTEKDRKFLSDLKLLCTKYNNMPFNSIKEKVDEFIDSNALALFIDIREPSEIETAKQAFNAETVLVKRDSVKHITSNVSDENVFNYKYDYIIENNGDIDDLNNMAKRFVYELWSKFN